MGLITNKLSRFLGIDTKEYKFRYDNLNTIDMKVNKTIKEEETVDYGMPGLWAGPGYEKRNISIITLDGNDISFTLKGYDNLFSKLKKGETIKVTYRDRIMDTYDYPDKNSIRKELINSNLVEHVYLGIED